MASVQQAAQISIPATTLDRALIALARQANVDLGSTERGLGAVRTPALVGTMPVREALERLLRGSGYRAVAVDGRSFRVVRAQQARATPAPRHEPPTAPARPLATPEIIVIGSKQRVPLLRYPGSITVVTGNQPPSASGAADMSAIARTLPVLQHTELGAGRNKLFIRGIADSSFNGATQATASTYFDDVLLAYSGADPGLRLYDMRQIEVMEGPQGTLYGSGSIGGIIRLTPNPVDLNVASGSVTGGATLTQGGDPGSDLAGIVNLPLRAGSVGVRAVAYHIIDGGYIDDLGRGSHNVNRTTTLGGRATLRLRPGADWRIDIGGLGQVIRARDSQYAMAGLPPLSRLSSVAQPFDNSVLLGRVQVTKDWASGLQLVSNSSVVGYNTRDRFDASPRGLNGSSAPILYEADGAKRLLTHETRLSRTLSNGGSWVTGFTLLEDRDKLSRSLGSPDNGVSIIGVTNLTRSASVFGELTVPLSPRFHATFGARLTIARTDGEPSTNPRDDRFVKGSSSRRIDPTIAFSWLLRPRLALFGRYQSGFRTGGLAVARGIGRVADYQSDSISVGELGLRQLRTGTRGVAFSTSVSVARWTGIQADLVSLRGNPYTANIGDAHIATLEATGDWIPADGFHVSAAFLYTLNRLTGPFAELSPPSRRRLPDTPAMSTRLSLSYDWETRGHVSFHTEATGSYVGHSTLGAGTLLDIRQGGYALLGWSGNARWRNLEFSLSLENITNSRGNLFAFGNPFALAARDQQTPMRPINLRLGMGIAW